jgi:hypothetical protein
MLMWYVGGSPNALIFTGIRSDPKAANEFRRYS